MVIFLQIIWSFVEWLKYPLIFGLSLIALFLFLVYFNVIVGYIKGKRFKDGVHVKVRKRSILRRLLVDLPYQISEDMFEKDPETFKYKGLVIFEGRQGNGKTIAMCQFARQMQREYPKALCLSNLDYKNQDEELNDWRKLVDFKNGKWGVIAILDETQNWFSSNQSKNFPPEMLEVITQNRKNRRIILGTAQNFYLLAKAIRSQATEVRRCVTLFGCLTIVKRVMPILDSEGNVKEWQYLGRYFFVHDKELRDSYDTYYVIKSLSESGFQERQADSSPVIHNTIFMPKNKRK